MGAISIRDVGKRYGTGPKANPVIHGVDAEIADGEFIVIVGPSGCGKSTLLRMVAGLEEISGGEIAIGPRVVNELEPSERDIAMVFQNYALYPHMSVADNMSFALRLAGTNKGLIDEKVRRAAEILNLLPYLDRTPRELSGGQRQRVAIGRAIVRQPKVFLFDEPLSNLDAALRGQTRVEIAKLHRDLGATMVYVTHDQVEAMTLADRVVVLRDGAIEQVGTPLELYDKPANQFVAQFIGTPRMNVVSADAVPQFEAVLGLKVPVGGFVGLRPESIALTRPTEGQVQGHVDLVEALGAETLIHVSTDRGAQFVSRLNERTTLGAGDAVGLRFDPAAAHLFDAKGRVSRNATAAAH